MKQITVMEKYPVYTLEVDKNETSYKNIDDILNYLKEQIEAHRVAVYIGEFDHYAHTSSLAEGDISEDIKDAKNIICCFGKHLPKAVVLAVRPRSIGVAERDGSFVISFLEAPNPEANTTMENWVKGIANL
ncbi:MAG: hypothetical protein U9R27_11265 [Campylobacterota bacterium]|nr:hypothetical protein [Campylobacterota bacterium]